MKNQNKGITLIALIITVIILLILAAVSISALSGAGIFEKAKKTSEIYSEQNAKEKLELTFMNLILEKQTNSEYNSNEFLTAKLQEKGFIVNNDIVIVDGYKFQIDRSVPDIVVGLGKGEENREMQVTVEQTLASDYTKSTLKIGIVTQNEVTEVKVSGESVDVPEPQKDDNNKNTYTIEKEVIENKIYDIYIKAKDESYKTGNITVAQISENLNIKNLSELEQFRDRVNNGATYEGKIVILVADIDINEGKWTKAADGKITFTSDAKEWVPIGDFFVKENNCFKGTFEGNNHKVDGIYINSTDSTKTHRGFFAYINNANIKDLSVSGNIVTAGVNSGGLVGSAYKANIQNCVNNINVDASDKNIGGIAGVANVNCVIENCTNKGIIKSSAANTGGIVGYCNNESIQITKCVNEGTISATQYVGGIIGDIRSEGEVQYCINNGVVNASSYSIGGVIGYALNSDIQNCVNLKQINNTSANMYNIGGIVGTYKTTADNTIKQCYNTGAINLIYGTDNRNIGGIVGYIQDAKKATVEDCYNTGNISNSYKQTGGIVGLVANTPWDGVINIKNTYNVGILSGSSYIGGIVGRRINVTTDGVTYTADLSVTNSYYLSTCGGSSIDEDTSKTVNQMQSLASTLGTTLWQNDEKDETTSKWKYNAGYPILKWQLN